jgi:hypothetical protein
MNRDEGSSAVALGEPAMISGRELVDRFPALSLTLATMGQWAADAALRASDDSPPHPVADKMADTDPREDAD